MVLGTGGSQHPYGPAHQGEGLAVKGIVSMGPGSPIDSVLENSRHRIVVFGCSNQDGVCCLDLCLKLSYLFRLLSFQILVEGRDALKVKDLEKGPFRHQLCCCAQQ